MKDSLANSNGRLERRMEVHKTSIKMVIFCRNPMVGWWGLYIGLFEGLCLTAGRRQRNGRKAVNQHEVAIHLRNFSRLCDCKQNPRFFHFALGSCLAYVGPMLAYVSPSLAYVGPVLALRWPMLAPCWPSEGWRSHKDAQKKCLTCRLKPFQKS